MVRLHLKSLLGSLVLLTGCDLILGIEDWTDPPGEGAGGSGATSTSTTGGGGASSTGGGGSSTTPLTGTCGDGILDFGETDVDCGGDACAPCAAGEACLNDADCQTLACVEQACAAEAPTHACSEHDPENPTCNDCVQNSDETDVDCGGDACLPCEAGEACLVDADCFVETICQAGTCTSGTVSPICASVDPLMPSCIDCEQNGDETGVDCGGDACPPCP